MATPRKYTQRTRAKAVGIAIVDGVTAAERVTGIPKTTIQDWTKRPEYVHLRTTARETVIESLWVGIQVGIEEVTAGLRGEGNVHHKAMALQTLAERYALLTGDATSRTESRDLNDVPDSVLVERLHLVPDGGEGASVEAAEKAAG